MMLILGIIIGLLICVIVALVLSYKITISNFIDDLDVIFGRIYSYVHKDHIRNCVKKHFRYYPEEKEEK